MTVSDLGRRWRALALPGAAGIITLIFVLGPTLPCRARAETSRPEGKVHTDQRAKQTAQQHLERGNDLFRRDEIAGALAEFQAAFDVYPSPKLRFNLGQCERALGHAGAAATQFERFLADAADVSPALRAEAERYLTEARANIADSKTASAAPAPEPPSETPAPAAAAVPAAPAPPQVPAPVVTTTARPQPTPLYARWWFWTAVGAVVVGAAVTTFALMPRDPACGANTTCY